MAKTPHTAKAWDRERQHFSGEDRVIFFSSSLLIVLPFDPRHSLVMTSTKYPRRTRKPTEFYNNPINHEDEMDLEGGFDFAPSQQASRGFDSATALDDDTSSSAYPSVSSRALKRHKDTNNGVDDENYDPNSPQKKKAARVSNKQQVCRSLSEATILNPSSATASSAAASKYSVPAGMSSRPTIVVNSKRVAVDPGRNIRWSHNPLVRRVITKPIRECTDINGNIDLKRAVQMYADLDSDKASMDAAIQEAMLDLGFSTVHGKRYNAYYVGSHGYKGRQWLRGNIVRESKNHCKQIIENPNRESNCSQENHSSFLFSSLCLTLLSSMSTVIRVLSEYPLVRYHSYDAHDKSKINWRASIDRKQKSIFICKNNPLQSVCRKAIDQAIQAARDKPRNQRNQNEELLAAEPIYFAKEDGSYDVEAAEQRCMEETMTRGLLSHSEIQAMTQAASITLESLGDELQGMAVKDALDAIGMSNLVVGCKNGHEQILCSLLSFILFLFEILQSRISSRNARKS